MTTASGPMEQSQPVAGRRRRLWHPPILSYHRIADEPNGYLMSTTPAEFARQMAWLKRHHFRVVPLAWVVAWLDGQVTLPPRTVAITFDDGYREILDGAVPALLEHGFRATIFLVADRLGASNDWDVAVGYPQVELLDWRDVEELSRLGFAVGSHSATHADLTQADVPTLERELAGSKATLEQRLGTRCDLFSYPYNRLDRRTVDAVQAAGYQAACAGDGRSYTRYCLDRVVLSQRNPAAWWLKASGYYFLLRRYAARLGLVEVAGPPAA